MVMCLSQLALGAGDGAQVDIGEALPDGQGDKRGTERLDRFGGVEIGQGERHE